MDWNMDSRGKKTLAFSEFTLIFLHTPGPRAMSAATWAFLAPCNAIAGQTFWSLRAGSDSGKPCRFNRSMQHHLS